MPNHRISLFHRLPPARLAEWSLTDYLFQSVLNRARRCCVAGYACASRVPHILPGPLRLADRLRLRLLRGLCLLLLRLRRRLSHGRAPVYQLLEVLLYVLALPFKDDLFVVERDDFKFADLLSGPVA